MTHRRRFIAHRVNVLMLVLPLAGCGDYGETTDEMATGATTGPADTMANPEGPAANEPAGPTGAAAPTPAAGATGATGATGAQAGATGAGATGAPAEPVAGPPPEASCDAVMACGGDPVGTWAVAECPLTFSGELDMTGFGLGCHTAPITTGTLQVAGTWTANTDGTFTDNTTTTGTQEVELPQGCLEVSGTVTSCDRVGDPVRSSLGYSTFDCVDNAETGGCTCSATIDQTGGAAAISFGALTDGDYTAADNVITTTNGRNDTLYEYCVMGDTMVMSLATPGKTGTVSGPIVLVKQ